MSGFLNDKIKILIVDDDELSTRSLKLLLENVLSEKYEIYTLNTGEVAVEEIERNLYDIVFLDNKLPGKSGLSILKEIGRKNIRTNVIFLTGYSDEETAVKAMKLGAKDYIAKGNLDVERLIEAINEITLESCSKLELSPEALSRVRGIFSLYEELTPRQTFEVRYGEQGSYDKELIEALELLCVKQYAEKTRIFSTVVCPHCGSLPDELYLVCPVCNSTELVKGEVIEHHKCHHIDFKTNFVGEDGSLVCPKCEEKLKQIGVDYVKVGISYKCNNSHIFPSPEHRYFCRQCKESFSEDESKLVNIYEYRILSKGKISLNICDVMETPEVEKFDEYVNIYK